MDTKFRKTCLDFGYFLKGSDGRSMRHLVMIGIVCALFVERTLIAKPSLSSTVTLHDVSVYAIANNYTIQGLRASVQVARERVAKTKSLFLPSLALEAGGDTTPVYQSGHVRQENEPFLYASVAYNLYNGERDLATLKRSYFDLQRAELRLKQEELNVSLSVEAAYYTYLFREELLDLLKENITRNDTILSLVRKRHRAGSVSDADVLEFELEKSHLASTEISLMDDLELARLDIKRLLGHQIGTSIQPTGKLIHEHIEGNLMTYINYARQLSLPISLASQDLEISHLDLKRARSSWYPRINIDSKYGLLAQGERPQSGNNALSGSIRLTLDLFNGFRDQHTYRAQVQEVVKSKAHLKGQILTILIETERSFRSLKTIEKRIDLERTNLIRAKRYYKVVRKEYLVGLKNARDLAAAAAHLRNVKHQIKVFKHGYLMDKTQLERAIGRRLSVKIHHNNEADHD